MEISFSADPMPFSMDPSADNGKRKIDDVFGDNDFLSNLANIIDSIAFSYSVNRKSQTVKHDVAGKSEMTIGCPSEQSGSIALWMNDIFMLNTFSTRQNLQLWRVCGGGVYAHVDLMCVRGRYVVTPAMQASAGETERFELWYKTYHAYTKIITIVLSFE